MILERLKPRGYDAMIGGVRGRCEDSANLSESSGVDCRGPIEERQACK